MNVAEILAGAGQELVGGSLATLGAFSYEPVQELFCVTRVSSVARGCISGWGRAYNEAIVVGIDQHHRVRSSALLDMSENFFLCLDQPDGGGFFTAFSARAVSRSLDSTTSDCSRLRTFCSLWRSSSVCWSFASALSSLSRSS